LGPSRVRGLTCDRLTSQPDQIRQSGCRRCQFRQIGRAATSDPHPSGLAKETPHARRRRRFGFDRLTRSLSDFAKLVELFDQNGVSFVSVTQVSICLPW
jgi:hypothetical protein